MHRVFVYGTLKRGFENHRLMERAVFIGDAHTVKTFRMLDGPFPVLRDGETDCHQIAGELYEVDDATLDVLDDLEDTSSGMYERIETDIMITKARVGASRAFLYIGCAAYWDYRPAAFYANVDARGHLDWKPDGDNRN